LRLQDFVERTGLPVTAIAKALDEAERKGLITRDMARVRPTERGFDFLNDLQALFLADRRKTRAKCRHCWSKNMHQIWL
jgi:predicted methyltransferase